MVGGIAHAIQNVGGLDAPDSIMVPWRHISIRLGRNVPSLTAFDFLCYNVEIDDTPTDQDLSDSECDENLNHGRHGFRPFITLTGSMAEANSIIQTHAFERAAARLVGTVIHAQQAVMYSNDRYLRESLVDLISVIEGMTVAFQSAGPRAQSPLFMDHVERGRALDVLTTPVLPGEKTGSGLLLPSIHLLDVFFSRGKYKSHMGMLALKDRSCMPNLHRGFFDSVSKVSILDYILQSDEHEKHDLFCLFRRALCSFASETGFLGKHRIRLAGYMEMSSKIGRMSPGDGLKADLSWTARAWRNINYSMQDAMRERLEGRLDWNHAAVATECRLLEGFEDVYRLTANAGNALVYKAGDRVAFLTKNDDSLVREALNALGLNPDAKVVVKDEDWLRELIIRGIIDHRITGMKWVPPIQMRADRFLQIAFLQDDDHDLQSRISQQLSVGISALVKCTKHRHVGQSSIAILCEASRQYGLQILAKLDEVIRPLAPWCYPVASHQGESPTTVSVVFRRMRNTLPITNERRAVRGRGLTHLESPKLQDIGFSRAKGFQEPSIISRAASEEKKSSSFTSKAILLSEKKIGEPNSKHSIKSVSKRVLSALNSAHSTMQKPARQQSLFSTFRRHLGPEQLVSIRIIPELDFRMPEDPAVPIVMVSLGLGVVSFLSFLKELAVRKRRNKTCFRKAWLILGARSRASIPFLSEIEDAVCKQNLLHFSLAISGENVHLDEEASNGSLVFRNGSPKRVQELIEKSPVLTERLSEMISKGGHVFASGKPDLEPLTRKLILMAMKRHNCDSVLTKEEGKSRHHEGSADYVTRMIAERKFHFDCDNSEKPRMPDKKFTPADVAENHTLACCWTIFRNGVYDITEYLTIHPGGPKILLDKGGRDMTIDFGITHGAENNRIISMMEAYRIGIVKNFSSQCKALEDVMKEWSIPLLDGVLERKSVFLLDWNCFPGLKAPASFTEWRSQASSDQSMSDLCKKVWDTHEPEMFRFVTESILNWVGNVLGNSKVTEILKTSVESERSIVLEGSRFSRESDLFGTGASEFLKESSYFFEAWVRFAIKMQRIIEEEMEKPDSTESEYGTQDRIHALAWNIMACFASETSEIYRQFPGQCSEAL